MNKKRIFVDVNAIQTLPPSNINRDDTGSPKTCLLYTSDAADEQ